MTNYPQIKKLKATDNYFLTVCVRQKCGYDLSESSVSESLTRQQSSQGLIGGEFAFKPIPVAVDMIQFLLGCWQEATLSCLPGRALHMAAQNITACFIIDKQVGGQKREGGR